MQSIAAKLLWMSTPTSHTHTPHTHTHPSHMSHTHTSYAHACTPTSHTCIPTAPQTHTCTHTRTPHTYPSHTHTCTHIYIPHTHLSHTHLSHTHLTHMHTHTPCAHTHIHTHALHTQHTFTHTYTLMHTHTLCVHTHPPLMTSLLSVAPAHTVVLNPCTLARIHVTLITWAGRSRLGKPCLASKAEDNVKPLDSWILLTPVGSEAISPPLTFFQEVMLLSPGKLALKTLYSQGSWRSCLCFQASGLGIF